MTPKQKNAIELLWFVYGNNGPKHTTGNHKFLQNILRGDDLRDVFKPSAEVLEKVKAILKEEK